MSQITIGSWARTMRNVQTLQNGQWQVQVLPEGTIVQVKAVASTHIDVIVEGGSMARVQFDDGSALVLYETHEAVKQSVAMIMALKQIAQRNTGGF